MSSQHISTPLSKEGGVGGQGDDICMHTFLQNIIKVLKKINKMVGVCKEGGRVEGTSNREEASSGDRKPASTGQGGGGEGKVGEREEGNERELELVYKVLNDCFKKQKKEKKACIHRTFHRQEEPLIYFSRTHSACCLSELSCLLWNLLFFSFLSLP